MATRTRTRRSCSTLQPAVLALVVALTALGCRAGGAGTSDAGAVVPAVAGATAEGPGPLTLATSVPAQALATPVGAAAPDPLAAVGAFAAAELSRDAHAAWSLLSLADRQRYQSPQVWAGERGQRPRLRAIEGLALLEAVPGGGNSLPAESVEIAAEVRFDPALDQNLGMIPASASARWLAVPEDGGWRLAYQRSSFKAHLPPEAKASDAALRWAQARQGCENAGSAASAVTDQTRLEVVGGVVGVAGLAQRLCKTTAAVRAEAPTALDPAEATAVVAAFGPQSLQWARSVTLTGAVPQRVVMGPLGDRWIAIGVLAP